MRYIATALVAFLSLGLIADVSDAGPNEESEAKDITLTGTIRKTEREMAARTIVTYVLTDQDGTEVRLWKPRAKKGRTAIDLEAYVDEKVNLVGRGTDRTRDGKRRVSISTIVSINKVDDGAGAAGAEEVPSDKSEGTDAMANGPRQQAGEISLVGVVEAFRDRAAKKFYQLVVDRGEEKPEIYMIRMTRTGETCGRRMTGKRTEIVARVSERGRQKWLTVKSYREVKEGATGKRNAELREGANVVPARAGVKETHPVQELPD